MKKYRVEFNTSGFWNEGVWEVLDETAEVKADDPVEAIDCIIDWMVDTEIQYREDEASTDELRAELEDYAWRAAEILNDEDEGFKWFDRSGEVIM